MSTIAFTGPAVVHGTKIVRENLLRLAESHGHPVLAGPSPRLDYLVTNNPNSGSRKAREAQRCGTQIITPEQFIAMCGGRIELRLKDL